MTWPCDEFETRLAMLPEIYRERRGELATPDAEVAEELQDFIEGFEQAMGLEERGLL